MAGPTFLLSDKSPMTLLKVWQGDDGKWRWHYNGSDHNTGNLYDPCETREEAIEDAQMFVEEGNTG